MTNQDIKNKIAPILVSAGIRKASVFGSVVNNTATADSDVDVVVEMPRPYSLFMFLDIKDKLQNALGRKVDLIEYSTFKPIIREHAMRNAVSIL